MRFVRLALCALFLAASATTTRADAPPQLIFEWGSAGTGPGEFQTATALAAGPDGGVYVSDASNHRIQKFTATGGFILAWGELGSGPGQFASDSPYGIAFDALGNVLVADAGNDRIQRFTSGGVYLGSIGSSGNGPGQLRNPTDVAVGASGAVYVADYLNTRVDKFDAAGEYLAQWSVPDIPLGITVDATENVFVSLWTLSRIEKYSSSGTLLDEFGGLGAGDGQFNEPWGLQFDTNQDLVIADNNNNRIQKLSPSGAFLVGWGAGPGTGNCQPGSFNSPYDVAIGPQGWIYVADTGCRRIQVFEEGTLSVSDRLAMQGGVRVWPVPFRQGSLSVTFHTPPGIGARSEVQVRDLAGRLVRTIADARRDAGSHGLSWDGKDERGRLLPTGIYCLSVRAGGQSQNVKVVVLR